MEMRLTDTDVVLLDGETQVEMIIIIIKITIMFNISIAQISM